MTKKKIGMIGSLGFLALLFIPVLIHQFSHSEKRNLQGIELEDIQFQEITFPNRKQDIQLAGMLLIPEGRGPFPAAVIIQGSGSSRRSNTWYLSLAQYLRKHGITVLLPDKRGSEKSGGDWRTASFQDLTTDTLAALDYLQDQDHVAVSYMGIIGMSQGGTIAPLIAHRTDEIVFLVNVVGGALPMHRSLVFEEKHNLREMGVLPVLSDLLAYPAAWSLIYIRQNEFWKAVGNFDPREYWKQVSIPSLVVYGEEDPNTPTRGSVKFFRSLQNKNIHVRVFRGSGHALQTPPGKGNHIFRKDALEEIKTFIHSPHHQ